MEKSIFEQLGGTYTQGHGGYLFPDLAVPETVSTGIWGMRRRDYLKRHRSGIYDGMLLSGKLNAHLAEIDRQATEMFEQLTRQMAAVQGITEQLKAEDQMAWVSAMNNIRNAAEEVVFDELIYS